MNNHPEPLSGGRRRGCVAVIGGIPGLFGLVLSILAGIYVIFWGLGAFLITSDPIRPAEAVALLSGGGTTRMTEAVRLYKDKYAKIFILTDPIIGSEEAIPETGSSGSSVQVLDALDMGIPRGAILITPVHPNSTLGETQELRDFLEQHHIQSCIIVTDPYHTQRTRIIVKDVFRNSDVKVMVRAVRSHWYRSQTWMFSSEGRQVTLSEYLKIVAYFALKAFPKNFSMN
jgi:uncharacterized SAM-binding protein YcdF (DUF218 family)